MQWLATRRRAMSRLGDVGIRSLSLAPEHEMTSIRFEWPWLATKPTGSRICLSEDFDSGWFILTPNVSPVRPVDPSGTIVRSHQMLQRMLRPGGSVRDLIDLMDEPHYPPSELCETNWSELKYGDDEIHFDVATLSHAHASSRMPSAGPCRLPHRSSAPSRPSSPRPRRPAAGRCRARRGPRLGT